MQEDLDFSTTDIDIDDLLPVKKVTKKEEKKKERQRLRRMEEIELVCTNKNFKLI